MNSEKYFVISLTLAVYSNYIFVCYMEFAKALYAIFKNILLASLNKLKRTRNCFVRVYKKVIFIIYAYTCSEENYLKASLAVEKYYFVIIKSYKHENKININNKT